MPAPSTYTYKLTADQGEQLEAILRRLNYQFNEVPYTRFAGKRDKVSVAFYTSGKLVIQGKDAKEFIEFVLEPEILQEARLGYEDVLNPELLMPRIGVDESGKGDFFGPLTIAGVYVNESIVKAWRDDDVRDSKNISSDRKIAEFTDLIQKTDGIVYDVVVIGNDAYNRLYQKMGSVNKVLAWGHARVIENLMARRQQMKPEPVRVISDQFASDKATVGKALMELGREIELIQRHKAESDVAVAAASILARHAFVTKLKDLGRTHDIELPKGASKQVEAAGREFVEQHGAENLPKVSKMHFRTSFRVRGLPEPAKKEWRKRS